MGSSPRGDALVLEARRLTKSYGARLALDGVSLEARRGELVACIGPNGAGKTTLLSIIAGVRAPDSGTIDLHAGEVGWIPQQPALYGKLTVAENLRLFARLERVSDVEGAVERMLEQAALEESADLQVARLSGGNRQRVNVAIGLLAQPSLLLLDEPSSALDPRQRERLWDFIGELAHGGTAVVYATHLVTEAERYADRVLVLADGERLFWGAPSGLQQAVGNGRAGSSDDFEAAFVSFLHRHGH